MARINPATDGRTSVRIKRWFEGLTKSGIKGIFPNNSVTRAGRRELRSYWQDKLRSDFDRAERFSGIRLFVPTRGFRKIQHRGI